MSTRTVRLDEESERVLKELQRETGLSVSALLKSGLVAAREQLRAQPAQTPFEIYRSIDLGPGGYARAPARRAKQAIRGLLARKPRR